MYPAFKERSFVSACLSGLDDLELTPRAWHIAAVLHQHLPAPYRAAARILVASLGPEQQQTDTFGKLRGSISLAPMTTRTPYPGLHRLELLVNGVAYPLARFIVLAS